MRGQPLFELSTLDSGLSDSLNAGLSGPPFFFVLGELRVLRSTNACKLVFLAEFWRPTGSEPVMFAR